MEERLIIIGASGHGKVAADIAIKMNRWQEILFLDDDKSKKTSMELDVVGGIDDAYKYQREADFFVAIGNSVIREKIQHELSDNEFKLKSLIHPSAILSLDVEYGVGNIIMAGVVINSSTKIGNGCIINTSSSIDHDCTIDDYVHIAPGVKMAGNVRIGKGTWLGIGSIVSNNVKICSGCVIGAGAVVLKDITEPGIYVGIPARRLKT